MSLSFDFVYKIGDYDQSFPRPRKQKDVNCYKSDDANCLQSRSWTVAYSSSGEGKNDIAKDAYKIDL